MTIHNCTPWPLGIFLSRDSDNMITIEPSGHVVRAVQGSATRVASISYDIERTRDYALIPIVSVPAPKIVPGAGAPDPEHGPLPYGAQIYRGDSIIVSADVAALIVDARGLRILVVGPSRRTREEGIVGYEGLMDPAPIPLILRDDSEGVAARIVRTMTEAGANRIYVPRPEAGYGSAPIVGVRLEPGEYEYVVATGSAWGAPHAAGNIPLHKSFAYLDRVADLVHEIYGVELVRPAWLKIPRCVDDSRVDHKIAYHNAMNEDYQNGNWAPFPTSP